VDLTTGNRTLVSNASTGSGLNLTGTNDVALDATNKRALIVDRSLRALVAVDLVTGNRTIVSDVSTGSGPGFFDPSSITLDAANNRALIIDQIDYRGIQRALVAVDLATGNRTIVSDASTSSGPVFVNPIRVTLDTANKRALVIDGTFGSNALLAVDLATGDRTIVSDVSKGSGPAFINLTGVTLDAANKRALVTDSKFGLLALVAVDLTTGNRTIVTDASTGSGPAFISPDIVTLDAANNRALVIDSGLNALVAVELVSGDRVIVSR